MVFRSRPEVSKDKEGFAINPRRPKPPGPEPWSFCVTEELKEGDGSAREMATSSMAAQCRCRMQIWRLRMRG